MFYAFLQNFKSFRRTKKISPEYFVKMLSEDSLKLCEPFLNEEAYFMEKILNLAENKTIKNMAVFGAGPLLHLDFAQKYNLNYFSVEPNSIMHNYNNITNYGKLKIINSTFEDFNPKNHISGPSLYVFVFNVVSYLSAVDKKIMQILEPHDIAFITTWSKNDAALKIRHKYIDHLNSATKSFAIDPNSTNKITNLKILAKNIDRKGEFFAGKVCDVLLFR